MKFRMTAEGFIDMDAPPMAATVKLVALLSERLAGVSASMVTIEAEVWDWQCPDCKEWHRDGRDLVPCGLKPKEAPMENIERAKLDRER